MFPLRDFLNRHGRRIDLENVLDKLQDLLPNYPVPANGVEVFQADQDGCEHGAFEFKQCGYDQAHAWHADIVILLDSLTVVLLQISSVRELRSATTLLVASITSATFKPGNLCQENTHKIHDE